MTPEKDKYLCDKYPKIFADRHTSIYKSCMGWGFEHGDGWFNILDVLCKNIQHHIDCSVENSQNIDTKEIPQVVARQVKEKYGGLCFYYSGGDEYIEGLVAMAEAMSYVTCEKCGNPGKTNKDGWISTLCTSCR